MGVRKLKSTTEDKGITFTEEYIQKKLNGFFAESTKKYVIENLHVFSWESDKLIETRSGLIYEFEIKVSRGDFKNDFKNKKDKHAILEGTEKFIPSVADLMEKYGEEYCERYFLSSKFKKPNYFYYAVPEGLVEESEIPPYAGLIYIMPPDNIDKDGKYVYGGFKLVRKAPKISDTKYTDDELGLVEKFYYNMLSWKEKCQKMKEKILLSESTDHKIPYVDLLEKYEKAKRENKALKNIVDYNGTTMQQQQRQIMDDSTIIRSYRKKVKEYEKDFNPFDFEYDVTKKDNDEECNESKPNG